MISYSLVVCLIGLIVWAIGTEWWVKAQLAEAGRLMFFAGLLAWLLSVQGKYV